VGSKVKAHKTSGGRKTLVRHTIPLGIVIFLVVFGIQNTLWFLISAELTVFLAYCSGHYRTMSKRSMTPRSMTPTRVQ